MDINLLTLGNPPALGQKFTPTAMAILFVCTTITIAAQRKAPPRRLAPSSRKKQYVFFFFFPSTSYRSYCCPAEQPPWQPGAAAMSSGWMVDPWTMGAILLNLAERVPADLLNVQAEKGELARGIEVPTTSGMFKTSERTVFFGSGQRLLRLPRLVMSS